MNWNGGIGRTAAADHARLRADELEVLARLRGRRGYAGKPDATRGTLMLFSELPRTVKGWHALTRLRNVTVTGTSGEWGDG
jgi:hypothetical protein